MTERLLKRSGQYRFPLYVPESDEDMVLEFVSKCRREGTSASAVLMEYIRSLTPNSQPQVENDEHSCYKCGLVSDFLYNFRATSGRRLWACDEHFQECELKGLVRAVLKRPEKT